MAQLINLEGRTFGRLRVVGQADRRGPQKQLYWNCQCDCGTATAVRGQDLRRGHTVSCGCKRAESRPTLTHGKAKTPEHNIWLSMIARCENPNIDAFQYYGGRGISVCNRWRRGQQDTTGFEYFLSDVGLRPSPQHSIERINPDGNYEPGNVRWATRKRNTRWVVYHGKKMGIAEAVRAAGSIVHRETAAIRIFRCGWTVERAVETPSAIAYTAPQVRKDNAA